MVFLSEQVLICIWREIRRIIYKHYIFLFLILFSRIIYFLFEFLYFLNSFLFIKTFIIFGFLKTITSIFFYFDQYYYIIFQIKLLFSFLCMIGFNFFSKWNVLYYLVWIYLYYYIFFLISCFNMWQFHLLME